MSSRGSKALIGVLAVLVVVFAGVAGYFYMNNMKLKEQVSDLESQVSSLEQTKSSLQSKVSQLQQQVNSLTQERNQLQHQINTLENEKTSLQSQINDLNNQIDQLNSQINQLNNLIELLNQKISDLNNIIELNYYDVLVDDQTINFPAFNTTVYYYDFNFEYAGYLYIWFSATGTAEITVVGNYYGYEYQYTISSSGGEYIIPVLPGSVTVYMKNPNILFSLTLTIYIEYNY